jgi:hypothetical protein
MPDTVPEIVAQKAHDFGLSAIYLSTRKDKKYMIRNGAKWIHFGAKGYEDFTYHHDEARREKFRRRNKRWATAQRLTPAWLSYYLLW